ncbi:MAG: ccoG [Hyphomicrobiales bacterium]|nr:ccoG [Hyphomicrobiales bacterium]
MSVKQQQAREAALEAQGVEVGLYAAHQKIYPQAVSGKFRNIKWAILIVTLGIYYFLPFVRWDRGPNAPSQAVLVDLDHHRFYFFFIEIWPQEVYYLTGLLIIAAVTLFLMNAVAGRLWCGYLCPQTVWTDLFFAVERLIEGDRRERMKKDGEKWNLETFAQAMLKHWTWLMIAWWTGGAWVLYFADAPTLVYQLATFQGPVTAYVWIAILTFTTYFFAGYMREQVCTYMCPWPRIQAALTDEWALNVTYRYDRGEPRNSLKKAAALRAANQPAGDCVDCNQCVVVCPTGVDIRDGLQIDCIQCGLCIDACDTVMAKVGRPTGLIGYDTDINVKRREAGLPELKTRILRARTIVYAAVIAIVGSTMAVALATRNSSGLAVIHDRNPLFVTLQDGGIRNAYTVRLSNKIPETRSFEIRVEGFDPAQVDSAGGKRGPNGWPVLSVDPDQTLEDRVFVTLPRNAGKRDHDHQDDKRDIVFNLVDLASGASVRVKDHFMQPDGDKK